MIEVALLVLCFFAEYGIGAWFDDILTTRNLNKRIDRILTRMEEKHGIREKVVQPSDGQ